MHMHGEQFTNYLFDSEKKAASNGRLFAFLYAVKKIVRYSTH